MSKNKKPSIAIVGLTSCEGCQFAILDLHQKFLELTKYLDIQDFRLIEDSERKAHYDICFIEGNPVTKDNENILKELRKISDVVVVLGNCAELGGVWEQKNYHDKNKIHKKVYKNIAKSLENRDIIEVPKTIKVEYVIPGCPINAQNFLALVYSLLNKTKWALKQNPVCYECQINKNPCLLQEGKICLGPIALGGCNAVCLNSSQECWACRGILEQADDPTSPEASSGVERIKNLIKILNNHGWSHQDILEKMEFFGVRDRIELAMKEIKLRTTK